MRIRAICIFMTLLIIIIPLETHGQDENIHRFVDVPVGHWAESVIHRLRDLGITNGLPGGMFGLGDTLTRAQFVTFLVRLKAWEFVTPETPTYSDVSVNDWFYKEIETASFNGVFKDRTSDFRPLDNITREEMAVMIINTLGYEALAQLFKDQPSMFVDVSNDTGYITILNDFGIVNGKGNGVFAPKETAKREEAAAILIRMYDKLNGHIVSRNAFYADSSYSQMEAIQYFDSVSFGWAKLSYDDASSKLILVDNKPEGYEEPVDYAKTHDVDCQLSILASNRTKITDENSGIITYLINNSDVRDNLIDDIIVTIADSHIYDGVVIDFEELLSEDLQKGYNTFLSELDSRLEPLGRSLTVMVQPSLYYKGYDFRAIGEVADQIIIMAHDYNTTLLTKEEQNSGYSFTPVAPMQQVYETLKSITDLQTGVSDRTKISLQLSMASAQWGINADKSIYNSKPYQPTYEMIYNRLIQEETSIVFNVNSQSPKASYYNDKDMLAYTIWYEDSRSVDAKIKLAKMFGIEQISIWRLGNIPNHVDETGKSVYMDVFDTIIGE